MKVELSFIHNSCIKKKKNVAQDSAGAKEMTMNRTGSLDLLEFYIQKGKTAIKQGIT